MNSHELPFWMLMAEGPSPDGLGEAKSQVRRKPRTVVEYSSSTSAYCSLDTELPEAISENCQSAAEYAEPAWAYCSSTAPDWWPPAECSELGSEYPDTSYEYCSTRYQYSESTAEYWQFTAGYSETISGYSNGFAGCPKPVEPEIEK